MRLWTLAAAVLVLLAGCGVCEHIAEVKLVVAAAEADLALIEDEGERAKFQRYVDSLKSKVALLEAYCAAKHAGIPVEPPPEVEP